MLCDAYEYRRTTAGKVIKSTNPDGSEYCNGWLHF